MFLKTIARDLTQNKELYVITGIIGFACSMSAFMTARYAFNGWDVTWTGKQFPMEEVQERKDVRLMEGVQHGPRQIFDSINRIMSKPKE